MKDAAKIIFFFVLTWMISPAQAMEVQEWTLRRAVAVALENNPDAAIAAERVEEARAHVTRAGSRFYPSLTIGTAYSGTDNPVGAFGMILNQRALAPTADFNNPGTTDNWNLHALVEWTLFDGGRRGAERRAAERSLDAADALRDAARRDIALATVKTMVAIVQADHQARTVDAHARSLREAIETAENRLEQGVLLEVDVLHFRVELARVQDQVLQIDNLRKTLERSFSNLLGIPHEPLSVRAEELEILAGLSPDVDQKTRRRELDAVQHLQDSASAQVSASRSGLFPHVRIFGRADRDTGWKTGESGESWSGGITVSYPLWDGRKTRGEIRAADARAKVAEAERRKLELSIEEEQVVSRFRYEEALARLELSREWLALGEENVRLAEARYRDGAALPHQLTEAQANLTTARMQHQAAKAALADAVASLRHARGAFPIEPVP